MISLAHPTIIRIVNKSNTSNVPKISSLSQMVQKLEKYQKMTKGHNFVKNMTIKNPESHAYLQIMAKHSVKFQINSIKDVAGVAGTRSEMARTITLPKMAKTKIKNIRNPSNKCKLWSYVCHLMPLSMLYCTLVGFTSYWNLEIKSVLFYINLFNCL